MVSRHPVGMPTVHELARFREGELMILPSLAVLAGLILLVWSADRFVEGAANAARHAGMPPLLVGMVVIGFGTSAPEMVVSALAALQGNPGIALGNAYGSNITNIACILGVTALIRPITMPVQVLRKELPVLTGLTVLSIVLLWDETLSRVDAFIMLAVFMGCMLLAVLYALRNRPDAHASALVEELSAPAMPLKKSMIWLLIGFVGLVISSRILVWGAVEIASAFGVSDLIIGLTVIAIGTSLPELASSVVAARKGENDIALGNVIGSNMFNTLMVVGIAGALHPAPVLPEVLNRDMLVMTVLTGMLFLFGFGLRHPGQISRGEGGVLTAIYFLYTGYLVAISF